MLRNAREIEVVVGALVCGVLLGVAVGWIFGLDVGTIVLALGVLLLLGAVARTSRSTDQL